MTGFDNLQSVEVIDFSSNPKTCDNLPDYPFANYRGSVGGMLDNKIPIMCGGAGTRVCYTFQQGQWQLSFPMKEPRFHFSGMMSSPYRNSSHRMFILGGDHPASYSAEVLTSSGWEIIGPKLPRLFYAACIVSINDTTIMVIGSEDQAKQTYIFSTLTNTWSFGPSLANGRWGLGCGLIQENSQSKQKIIIAAGGVGSSRSVELLDGINSSWRAGDYKFIK